MRKRKEVIESTANKAALTKKLFVFLLVSQFSGPLPIHQKAI